MHRADQITPFYVMDLLAEARRRESLGYDVIHMEVGEPVFPTPEPVAQAAKEALGHQSMGYTPATGLPELKDAIAAYYREQGVQIDSERIVVTPGASGALQLALQVITNPSDRILVTDPGYPCNANLVRMAGCSVTTVAVDAASQFQPTLAHIEAAWNADTRAVLLAAPANPTGTVPDRAEFNSICQFMAERNGYVVLDEIYQGLLYDHAIWPTAAGSHPNLLLVNSFSKYFGMTGWRVGWAVLPEALVDRARRCASSLFLAAPTISQYAALAAFCENTRQILEARRARFSERKQFIAKALEKLPICAAADPVGAFYYYLDCGALKLDSQELCEQLLQHSNVVLTPGRDFGRQGASEHLRLAFVEDESRLNEAMQRLSHYLNVVA